MTRTMLSRIASHALTFFLGYVLGGIVVGILTQVPHVAYAALGM